MECLVCESLNRTTNMQNKAILHYSRLQMVQRDTIQQLIYYWII